MGLLALGLMWRKDFCRRLFGIFWHCWVGLLGTIRNICLLRSLCGDFRLVELAERMLCLTGRSSSGLTRNIYSRCLLGNCCRMWRGSCGLTDFGATNGLLAMGMVGSGGLWICCGRGLVF